MIEARTRSRDGRRVYDVRLRAPDGREISRTFLTKRAAEAFEASERVARNRGTWVDPRKAQISVERLAASWLASDPSKRPRSVETDQGSLSRHVLPSIGDREVGSITKADVQRLVNEWATRLAPSTVGRTYSTLRALFSYAEAADLISRNPCRNIRLPQVRLVDRPTLNADQLSRLADELGEDQGVMMWVGTVLGLRWSECAGLTVDSLEFLRGTLTVKGQLGRDHALTGPKSAAGLRTMAAPDWLLDLLSGVLTRRGLTAADPSALVFVNESGRPWSYSPWRRQVWLPACRRAELAGLRFHDLRSMASSALVANGVDVKTAQTRLGHANPGTTLAIYARASTEADRRAAEKLAEVFRPRDARGMVLPEEPAAEALQASDQDLSLQPQRDSNPCLHLERVVS